MLMGGDAGRREDKKRIGDLLLEAAVINREQLDAALEMKKRRGGRLCLNLIRLGALRADDLLRFLREQFGVAAVNLDRFAIDDNVLKLVPTPFALREKVVPLHVMNETLTVAMVDPAREEVIEELQRMTGKGIDALIAPEASIENALSKYYREQQEALQSGAGEGVISLGEEKEEKRLYLPSPPPEGYSPEDWLKRFFLGAIKMRSREIHLEPGEGGLRCRFRIGEKLVEGEVCPPEARRPVTALALGLARIDCRNSVRGPQEGRVRIDVRKRSLRAALSSYPTVHGERLVFHIVDEGLLGKGFQELGMSKEVADDLERVLHLPTGVLLVSAPPGHGKRTTFYNILHSLRANGGRNVMSLEHPVQYHIAGVSQTQVSPGAGLDFYYGLQSLLRQKPDVVGLTDISDCRTLELVFAAARQCLVVGLCSFWDNEQALEWIGGCGVSPAARARLLRGVLVQRVLPRICSHCRTPIETAVDITEGVRDKGEEELVFYAGEGCGRCGQTGRIGRLGIFEFMSIRFTLRDLIAGGEEIRILYDEAQRMGMWTLREDGTMKATQGLVDIRDVLDATREEGGED